MDSTELIFAEPVSPPAMLEQLNKIENVSEERKKQFARDFESVFINKLLEEMKNTIGDWGFEKEETSKQINGIFWLYLARDIADNGGFGLWKDISRFLTDLESKNTATQLDKNI